MPKIRLNKAAKELNISIPRAVEFLQSKGFEIDSNPNVLLEAEAFSALEQEFAADKKQKEDAKKELNKTQVKNAIDTLMNGEALLKSLADDINAGHVKGYSTSHWSRERTLSEINNESTKFQDLEPAVKQRIIELQNIQIQRVNAMYDGAAGNTYRFDEGGKKYDEFYDKLATLKKDFGIN